MAKKLVTSSPCGLVQLQTMNDGPVGASAVEDASATQSANDATLSGTSVTFVSIGSITPKATGRVFCIVTLTGSIPTANLNQITGLLFLDTPSGAISTVKVTTRGTAGAGGAFMLAAHCVVQLVVGTQYHFGIKADSDVDSMNIPIAGINFSWIEL